MVRYSTKSEFRAEVLSALVDISIDVVQLVSCRTPLDIQAVDKSGCGKSRAQHLDMSRCCLTSLHVKMLESAVMLSVGGRFAMDKL